MKRVCVTGAGGFIGHHLVTLLKQEGYWVRGVDLKYPEYTEVDADEFELLDLRRWDSALQATRGGGPGVRARCRHGRDGLHLRAPRRDPAQQLAHQPAHARRRPDQRRAALPVQLVGVHLSGVPADRDRRRAAEGEDAYPAQPQDAYGWEKLFTELLCSYYAEEYPMRPASCGSTTSTGRTAPTTAAGRRRRRRCAARWRSPRTAAASRSGATASRPGRSATSTTASRASTASCSRDYAEPLNLGTDEMVSINELAHIVTERGRQARHRPGAHHRVRRGCAGRNSDNSLLREVLGWEPTTSLRDGLVPTYRWIEKRLTSREHA